MKHKGGGGGVEVGIEAEGGLAVIDTDIEKWEVGKWESGSQWR